MVNMERLNTMPDFTKPLQTRDGREVEIFKTDLPNGLPVIGIIINSEKNQIVCRWAANGRCAGCSIDCDLVNVLEKRWINIYRHSNSNEYNERVYCSIVHKTEEIARQFAYGDYLATVEIPWK